jgi:HTH-type transcriptional regulator/antitoxin HigA
MEIRPIKTEADYEAALAEIAQWMDAEPDTPEYDRLDVLATLVEAYEDKVHPIEAPDPIEAIYHALEAKGLTVKDLEPILTGGRKNGRSRVWEIMNRKRRLSLTMIQRLNEEMGISADTLIQPYDLNHNAA